MAVFTVRYNVEFSKEIEAESEQDAIDKALETDEDSWDQSTSQYEAELLPKELVTVWHTCIDIKTGQFGDKGRAERCDAAIAEFAADREEVTPTTYNLGYANVYSRTSAEDSISRAEALRARELAKQHA